jgi:hypothetical protein
MTSADKADVAMYGTWSGYFFTLIPGISQVLQVIVLLVAIVSGVCAAMYHLKAMKKLG